MKHWSLLGFVYTLEIYTHFYLLRCYHFFLFVSVFEWCLQRIFKSCGVFNGTHFHSKNKTKKKLDITFHRVSCNRRWIRFTRMMYCCQAMAEAATAAQTAPSCVLSVMTEIFYCLYLYSGWATNLIINASPDHMFPSHSHSFYIGVSVLALLHIKHDGDKMA